MLTRTQKRKLTISQSVGDKIAAENLKTVKKVKKDKDTGKKVVSVKHPPEISEETKKKLKLYFDTSTERGLFGMRELRKLLHELLDVGLTASANTTANAVKKEDIDKQTRPQLFGKLSKLFLSDSGGEKKIIVADQPYEEIFEEHSHLIPTWAWDPVQQSLLHNPMVYSSGRAYFKSSVDGIMLVDNDKKDPITRKSLLPEGKNNTDIDSIRERERQQNRGRGRGRGREQVKKQQPLGYKDWNLKEAIKEWIFQETGYHLYDLQQAKYRDIIKRARDFFDAKNYDDAMKEYREAYDILPFSFDTNYYHPIDFYRNEEGKDEKKEEEKYNGNGKFQDLINYSDCLFIMQKFSRVSTYFNRIIRIWKKFEKEKDDKKLMTSSLLLPLDKIANIFFNRAWISEHHYCYSGLFIHSSSSIIKDLDMATKLNPNNYAYFQKKGEYQFFVGEDESSVSSFNSAIQLFLSSQFLDESEKEKDKNEKKREKILKNMLIGRANACINVENFQLAYEDFSRILLLPSTSLPLTTSVKEEKSEKNRGEGSKGSKVWEMMENKKKRREFLSIHWGYMKSLFGKKQYDDVLSHYQKLVTIINITESKYEEKSKESKVVDEDHDDDDDDDHYYKNGQDRDSLHIIGFSFYKQGKYSEALNIFDKCLELRGEEMDDDDEKDQLIASTYGHAMSSMMLAEKDKDISLLSECLEKVNRCIELSEGEYTTFFHGRGQLYERMGEFQKAFNNYSQIETVNRRNQLVSEANKINPLFDLDDLELRTKNVIHLIENFPKENEEKILQGKIKL